MGIPDEHSWLHRSYFPHDLGSAKGWKRRVLQGMLALILVPAVLVLVALILGR